MSIISSTSYLLEGEWGWAEAMVVRMTLSDAPQLCAIRRSLPFTTIPLVCVARPSQQINSQCHILCRVVPLFFHPFRQD